MDDLSDYTSEIIEFVPTQQFEKQVKVVEVCVSTDPEPTTQNKSVETTHNSHISTQTEISTTIDCEVDERKLADWLRKIYPSVEEQLLKGPTSLDNTNSNNRTESLAELANSFKIYQKITMDALENSQGIATWLPVHTNNAPILVASSKAPHDDWCDHLQQVLKVFFPKRMPTGNLVIFTEVKSIPLKACMSSLSTNRYNKNMFAGFTMDGDIHIWLCRSGGRIGDGHLSAVMLGSQEIEELCCATSPQGYAVALDWLSENRLLSFHTSGMVICWAVGKKLILENDFHIKPPSTASSEITAAICLSSNTFAVGVKDGYIYLCTITSFSGMRKQLEMISLKRHFFMISSLVRTQINGHRALISCDLSGQVYCHNITNTEEENPNATIKIPLPFKNAIACSKNGNIIYCPGNDGSLECYNISDGAHFIIQGALRGKCNFIACSDNGNWIIAGLYQDNFQLFYVED